MANDDFDPPPFDRRSAKTVAGWSTWTIIGGLVALALVIALALMAIFGWGFFKRSTADFRGKTGVIEKRADANYRIANYEGFYDLCASVQAKESSIRELRTQVKMADPGSTDYLLVNRQLAGTVAARAGDIAQYNADARKNDTKAHFLASDLPYSLDETQETTTCTAP